MNNEKTKNILRWSYKVARSVIFSAIIVIISLLILLYISLSIPPVQNFIKEKVESKLSSFLESEVSVGYLTISPFNEVIIQDVTVNDLNNQKCLEIGKLGAGLNFWKLLLRQEVEITYVELLDFKSNIYQSHEGEKLNIDFIIEAFKPKDKNKAPTRFNLKIHNIVLRGGEVSYSKLWKDRKYDGSFDSNHISLSNLSGDITIPKLSNDSTIIDVRRLSFVEKSGLQVKEIGGIFNISPDKIFVSDFNLRLPESVIRLKDFSFSSSFFNNNSNNSEVVKIDITNSKITPSNLSAFFPALQEFEESYPLMMSADISRDRIVIENLSLGGFQNIYLNLNGSITHYRHNDILDVELNHLTVDLNQELTNKISGLLLKDKNSILFNLIPALGKLNIETKGSYNKENNTASFVSAIQSNIGTIKIEGNGLINDNFIRCDVLVGIPDLGFNSLSSLLPSLNILDGIIKIKGNINLKSIKDSSGEVTFSFGGLTLANSNLDNIEGWLSKNMSQYSLSIEVDSEDADMQLKAEADIRGEDSTWDLETNIKHLDTRVFSFDRNHEKNYSLNGSVQAHAYGNSIDDIVGNLLINNFHIEKHDGRSISLSHLLLTADKESNTRTISLKSEILDVNLTGEFVLSLIPGMVKETLAETAPSLFPVYKASKECGNADFQVAIKDAKQIINFFKIPIIPLTQLTINGGFNSKLNHIDISTQIPYIQQGSNKLITDTYLNLNLNGINQEMKISAGTVYPTKKGLLQLDLDLNGEKDNYNIIIDFNRGRNVAFTGIMGLDVDLEKDPNSNAIEVYAKTLPSSLFINDVEWEVDESEIFYNSSSLSIDNFRISHDTQFLSINGNNDKYGNGEILVVLADINLDYLFDTLNIPHVEFGGDASGEVVARNIFSTDPDIATKYLFVKNLSYNKAVLGDGELCGRLNLPQKMVAIGADIDNGGHRVAKVDGGVWFGKDSLAFNFIADRVNIAFMQPFMSAFSSEVSGKGSGTATLYGNFSDIDMTGKIVAHDAEIMIDYINTKYSGSDTVFLTPGKIDIPYFKVKDKYGHTAVVEGVLTHRCFHEPEFKFTVKDLDNLLVYDTNAKINNLWYGKLFASGMGEVTGRPGIVTISADVETGPGSDFTFVLSDQQEAVKYDFLTFSDKRKEMLEETIIEKDTIPDFLKHLVIKPSKVAESSDIYNMDFRVSVTDDVRFNLIMDPVAGDKITAYGTGAMNMLYSSLTDELKLYGKYILDKGSYNFSLQDIILKDFTIKPGSSIAFTGDPYTGILDITAAYRVNTSLTELDKSFANDRELNRTSVPVEALLKVSGVLTSPTIAFDIELPTVTEETAQKVRSIISTEDMMSRQVLYLVALNKFYPPEYMTTSNSGGEWASIASSTISSQIQNMVGQITDKFTLAPSIRSDKGDFSDIEVDLALSSQLFNNRLILNGNLGYRDPSNSSTTFVGDFDLEYLLNKKGTWRVKAYNHFNDQNYYLKSSLTTQGIGIVWRKDFGLPRKEEKGKETEENHKDSDF